MKKAMSKKVIALVMVGLVMSTTVAEAAVVKKDESVYVTLDTDGTLEKTIVSDWIHSDQKGITVRDRSELSNIKNVKSDLEPIKSGENLSWEMEGSDLYYQGTSNKDIPIDISVKYYYEDEEIEPEDLAGKSGKVKIEIELTNKNYKKISINGKERNIYTPFLVAGEVTLPNDKFSEVTVDGGTMLSEGNNNIVAFAKMPGLKDSLELDSIPFDKNSDEIDKINNLTDGKVTIEMDAEEFSLGPIMLTATTDVSMLNDLDGVTDLNEYKNMLGQIKDNYDLLLSGENQINNGILQGYNELQEKMPQLKAPKYKNMLSLITDNNKVIRANILLKDAFEAENIQSESIPPLLNKLSGMNSKLNEESTKEILANSDSLVGLYNSFVTNKVRDLNFLNAANKAMYQTTNILDKTDNVGMKLRKLRSDVNDVQSKYNELDEKSPIVTQSLINTLNELTSKMTKEDFKKAQSALTAIDEIEKLTPLQQKLKDEVSKTEITDKGLLANVENAKKEVAAGKKDMNYLTSVIVQAKANQFIINIDSSLKALSLIVSIKIPENLNLNDLSDDITSYGEAYMLIKMQFAAVAAQYPTNQVEAAKAIKQKQQELKTIVDSVYSIKKDSDKDGSLKMLCDDLKSKIDGDFANVSKIDEDSKKLLTYKNTFNEATINSLNIALSTLKEIQKVDNLNKLKETEALLQNTEVTGALLGLLNQDTSNLTALKPMLNMLVNLPEESQQSLIDLSKSLTSVIADITANKETVNSIMKLANGVDLSDESIKTFKEFANSMSNAEKALDLLGKINLEKIDGNDVNILKNSSSKIPDVISKVNRLLDMQKDLKNSDDILRILKEAIEKNNVDEANRLINTLPSYTNKLNELYNGSKQLAEGMNEYGDKAINQLYNKGNDGLTVIDELSTAKNEIINASKDYGCYSGKSDNMDSSTKFIMKTKEIKYEAPQDDEEDESTTEKKGFWEWLKSLIGLD